MTNRIDEIKNYFPKSLTLFSRFFTKKYHIYLIGMILVDFLVVVYVSMQPYIFKKIIDAAYLKQNPKLIKIAAIIMKILLESNLRTI